MTTMAQEDTQIDLWQLGFVFAVEEPDPRIGRIEVNHTRWDDVDGELMQKSTKIDMVRCNTLIENDKFVGNPFNDQIVVD